MRWSSSATAAAGQRKVAAGRIAGARRRRRCRARLEAGRRLRSPRSPARDVLAFAGIGDPGRFFRTLRAGGIELVRERAFADHHPFSQGEIEALVAEAKRDALTLVTTEKDLARLRTAGDCRPGRTISCRSR